MPSSTSTPFAVHPGELATGPWEMLASMLPTADWTREAASGHVAPSVSESSAHIYEQLARALHRRERRHVLVTGTKGVGKTEAVRELARRAAIGEIPFLADKRFLWVDASNVGPEDSRACLETLATVAQDSPGVVLCLDGIDALLKRPNGGTNKPLLRAIASRGGVQIIGIMNRWAFNDLISSDAQMLDLFTRIEIEEPNEKAACEILKQKAGEFERDYSLRIDDEVIRKTISLASNYLLNESHPAKGIKVLRQACDDASFEATQVPEGRRRQAVGLGVDDVVRVVSQLSGIPEATLAGDTGETDFEAALAAAVVGQPRAVQAAATELRLIKAGLSEPDKPAGVLLFAGMTGVGKTELAKRIAELYSTSKRLTTYSMGNFTEPHSVSGIIGVPPGYVGHEEGGRLINELNADPYSVFLLDEAEKCHPNVWKPFLNLFDEGWIADQRGQKAYADRAIFILTTNAGDKAIAQMSRSNKPEQEIVDRVKATLSRVRQERSSQPVFTPQFLSRIKRTVVFGPLDENAMTGIARIIVKRVQSLWRKKRDKELIVPAEVIIEIAHRAHQINEKSNGEEGGRIVRKLISDHIEHEVQLAATDRAVEYRACEQIVVGLNGLASQGTESESAEPQLDVTVEFIARELVSVPPATSPTAPKSSPTTMRTKRLARR